MLRDFITLVLIDMVYITADKSAHWNRNLDDMVPNIEANAVTSKLQLAPFILIKRITHDVELLDEVLPLKLDHASEQVPLQGLKYEGISEEKTGS